MTVESTPGVETVGEIVARRRTEEERMQTSVSARQDIEFAKQQKELEAERVDLERLGAEATESTRALETEFRNKPTDVPLPDFKPTEIDANDFHNFAFALLGMALIGGVASRGDWMGVGTSLNGAMQGFLDANELKAQKNYADYKTKFDAALAKNRQAHQDYEDIIADRTTSMNMKFKLLEVAATRHQHADVQRAAINKDLERVQTQLEAHKSATDKIEEHADTVEQQLLNSLKKMEKTRQLQGGTPMNQQTVDRIADQYLDGDTGVIGAAVRGRGAGTQQSVQQINDAITRKMIERHMAPGDILANRAQLNALGATLRQTEQRRAGVERLTFALQDMEAKVLQTAKEVGLSNVAMLNQPMNKMRDAIGSKNLTKLRDLMLANARIYIEAVTMPGSNAQLHASSAEVADQMINANMTIGQIEGAFEAMNAEISAGGGALSRISQSLIDRIKGQFGEQDLQPGFRTGGAPQPLDGGQAVSRASTESLIDKYRSKQSVTP